MGEHTLQNDCHGDSIDGHFPYLMLASGALALQSYIDGRMIEPDSEPPAYMNAAPIVMLLATECLHMLDLNHAKSGKCPSAQWTDSDSLHCGDDKFFKVAADFMVRYIIIKANDMDVSFEYHNRDAIDSLNGIDKVECINFAAAHAQSVAPIHKFQSVVDDVESFLKGVANE